MRRGETIGKTLLLVMTALLWGFTFAFQSIGAQYVGTCTFLACRSWIGVVFLIPVIRAADAMRRRQGAPDRAPRTPQQKRMLWIAGLLCGIALMVASALQQLGIAHTTTARASFITALYVLLVPILSIFLGKMPEKKIWLCVLISVVGLYFLCFKAGGLGGLGFGDVVVMGCALVFAIQILVVDHYVADVDPVRLSQRQMLTQAVLASVVMVMVERPTLQAILQAAFAILFAGVISSGVAYTLQIIAQEGLNPTIASLTMCLESVFGAIGGWLILGQVMSAREIFGAALMFAAIVLAQVPVGKKRERGGA